MGTYPQRRVYREKKEPPVELKDIMEKDSYDKARAYSIDKSNFSLISGAFDQIIGTVSSLLSLASFDLLPGWVSHGRNPKLVNTPAVCGTSTYIRIFWLLLECVLLHRLFFLWYSVNPLVW